MLLSITCNSIGTHGGFAGAVKALNNPSISIGICNTSSKIPGNNPVVELPLVFWDDVINGRFPVGILLINIYLSTRSELLQEPLHGFCIVVGQHCPPVFKKYLLLKNIIPS